MFNTSVFSESCQYSRKGYTILSEEGEKKIHYLFLLCVPEPSFILVIHCVSMVHRAFFLCGSLSYKMLASSCVFFFFFSQGNSISLSWTSVENFPPMAVPQAALSNNLIFIEEKFLPNITYVCVYQNRVNLCLPGKIHSPISRLPFPLCETLRYIIYQKKNNNKEKATLVLKLQSLLLLGKYYEPHFQPNIL